MKSDSQQIRDFLDNLASESWLGRLRAKWVSYLYHYSEIANAVQILTSGQVSCRAHLEKAGTLPVDIASTEIISQTSADVKGFVRLYFRPLTPTQYHMEGFRPKEAISRNSHCRIPIFFLFDSRTILCSDNARFSDVNLAIHGKSKMLGSTAKDLAALNFKEIYSTGPIPAEGRATTVQHRNAEVVIPAQLDLSALRNICCRSSAEKDTLLYLLPKNLVELWGSRIYVSPNLYKRNWVYIENVSLSSERAIFEFSPDAERAGPFAAELIIRSGGNIQRLRRDRFLSSGKIVHTFAKPLDTYSIEMYLDGHIAFGGTYDEIDIPF